MGLRRTGGIQEEDVWKAADALLLAGERPTIERVRRALGRGSPNTVGPYLDAWFGALGGRLQDPKAFSPIAGAPEAVQVAARHFWETAAAHAREAVEAAYQTQLQAVSERDAAVKSRESALAEREHGLARALSEATERAKSLAEINRKLDRTISEQDRLISSLRDESAKLKQSLTEFERSREQDRQAYDRQRALADMRIDAERQRHAQELEQLRATERQMQRRAEELEGTATSLRTELDSLRNEASRETETLRTENAGLRREVELLVQRVTVAETDKASVSAHADAMLERVDALQRQLEAALRESRQRELRHADFVEAIASATQTRRPVPPEPAGP